MNGPKSCETKFEYNKLIVSSVCKQAKQICFSAVYFEAKYRWSVFRYIWVNAKQISGITTTHCVTSKLRGNHILGAAFSITSISILLFQTIIHVYIYTKTKIYYFSVL